MGAALLSLAFLTIAMSIRRRRRTTTPAALPSKGTAAAVASTTNIEQNEQYAELGEVSYIPNKFEQGEQYSDVEDVSEVPTFEEAMKPTVVPELNEKPIGEK